MTASSPFEHLKAGDGPALCRRYCSRLRAGSSRDLPGRSADGIALCLCFCRGFAAGQPILAARRPRRRPGER